MVKVPVSNPRRAKALVLASAIVAAGVRVAAAKFPVLDPFKEELTAWAVGGVALLLNLVQK